MGVVEFWSLLNQLGSEFENLHASHEQLLRTSQCSHPSNKEANCSTTPRLHVEAPNRPALLQEVLPEFEPAAEAKITERIQEFEPAKEVKSTEHIKDSAWEDNGLDGFYKEVKLTDPIADQDPCAYQKKYADQDRCAYQTSGSGLDGFVLKSPRDSPPRDSPRSMYSSNESKGDRGESLDLQRDRVKTELIAIFNELDADGTGYLEARELREALVAAGVPQARLQRVFHLADSDNSGTIELDEWIQAVMTPGDEEMRRLSVTLREKLDQDGGLLALTDSRNLCMINPLSFTRIAWDFMVSVICCYIAVVLPFSTGWSDLLSTETRDILHLIDRVVNYFFLLDVFMNFRTGYVNEDGELVMNWKKVARKYSATWFFFDVVSSLPTDEIPNSQLEHLHTIKILKLSKLVKILRIMKPRNMDLSHISDTLDDVVQSKAVQLITRKSRVFFYMLLLCHWMACGMKIADGGWLSSYQDVKGDLWPEYLTAVYWAMTTLTTVGYGDITPTCDRERAYATIAMTIGASFYGYVVGAITAVVSSSDLNSTAYHERMDLITAWFNHHRLPTAMKRTLRRYFKAFLIEKSAIDEDTIFSDLSHELQIEVGMYLIHEDVKNNPLFDGIGIGSVVLLQSVLKRVTIQAGYFLAKEGEVGIAMYILVAGCLEMHVESTGSTRQPSGASLKKSPSNLSYCQSQVSCLVRSSTMIRSREIVPGESFGQEILLGFRERHEYTVKALQKSKLEMVRQGEFFKVFQNMPNVLERIRRNALSLNPEWADKTRRFSQVASDESLPSDRSSALYKRTG